MPGATLSGGFYALNRDVFFVNLTMNMPSDNVGIDTNGFRIFVNGTLTTSLGHGVIGSPGTTGTGTGGSAGGTPNVLGVGVGGGGAGQTGTSVINSLGGSGGAGGVAGGVGGTATAPAAGLSTARSIIEALMGADFKATTPSPGVTNAQLVEILYSQSNQTNPLVQNTPTSVLTGAGPNTGPITLEVNAGDTICVWAESIIQNGGGTPGNVSVIITLDGAFEASSNGLVPSNATPAFATLPMGAIWQHTFATAGQHTIDYQGDTAQPSMTANSGSMFVHRYAAAPAPGPQFATIQGGAGGGGGDGGLSSVSGGSGGGGGNVVVIVARTITGNGTITAQGGAGAAIASPFGGGGGGGGGVIYLVYNASTYTGTLDVAGGAGGIGGGGNGVAGSPGTVVQIQAPG
jgi:hypothetical protein